MLSKTVVLMLLCSIGLCSHYITASASDMELSDSNTSQSLVDAKLTEDF